MFTLICGLPRAGKTTYSKQYEGIAKVIHLDECCAIQLSKYIGCNERVARASGDVVVDGIYDKSTLRVGVLHMYKGEGKRVCIWLNTPLEVREKRCGYIKQSDYFEPPTYSEGWDQIIIIGENDGV